MTYAVDGQRFRAVVDTGSPYLIVDATCVAGTQGQWGCYYGEGRASELPDSGLSFAGQDVGVQWRRGAFALTLEPRTADPPTGEVLTVEDAVFGKVRSYQGKGGSGAIFFGLVKDRGRSLRQPTLLEQTDIQSLSFDFRQRRMSLSRGPLIPNSSDAVPIVDLRRVGAPDLKCNRSCDSSLSRCKFCRDARIPPTRGPCERPTLRSLAGQTRWPSPGW